MSWIVYTEDNKYGSLYHVGEYIVKSLIDMGLDATLHTSTGEDFNGANIINLLPPKILPLIKQKRFLHYNALVNVFTPNPFEYTRPELAGIIASLQDHTLVCHSPQLYDELAAILKNTFSPHFRRSYGDRLKMIRYGVSEEFKTGEMNNMHKWIVPYNRLNETQKQFRLHSTVTNKALQLLALIDFEVQTDVILMDHPRSNRERYAKELESYNVITQPESREGYAERLQQYGGFLCTSKNESFGIYYLELLASGVVGVFLDRPWVRKLLPDYPYIVKKDELPHAMMHVIADYPASWGVVAEYWHKHENQFSIPKFTEGLVKLFE